MLSEKSTEKIKKLALKYKLKLVILFGGLAEGIYNAASDMDIAVLPENSRNFIDNEILSKLVYDFMEIEDIEKREADIILITSENPLLLYQIAKYGIPSYSKTEDDYMNFLSWARFTYEDNRRFLRGIPDLIKESLNKI